ncbi:MAG TPA: sigma-70 family RNA polymerase sigma factor [Polyangiaceae bacterium]|nr:sigma-70 family RNA polymerase sigma factor [Polyangiaceae bacterium]
MGFKSIHPRAALEPRRDVPLGVAAAGRGGSRGDGLDVGSAAPDAGASSAAPLGFDAVYEQHITFVWRSLRLLGVGEDLLEDAAQDVFVVVSYKLDEFEGRSSLRTWIFSIVQRTAANYRRRHRRKHEALVPLRAQVVGSEATPHAHAEAAFAAQRIESYAESLDPERRALFVLVLIEDVPVPEAARALGLPLNTAYSRVRALRLGLERALGRGEEER